MVIMNIFLTSSSTFQTNESVPSIVGFVTIEWQLRSSPPFGCHNPVSNHLTLLCVLIMKYFAHKSKNLRF